MTSEDWFLFFLHVLSAQHTVSYTPIIWYLLPKRREPLFVETPNNLCVAQFAWTPREVAEILVSTVPPQSWFQRRESFLTHAQFFGFKEENPFVVVCWNFGFTGPTTIFAHAHLWFLYIRPQISWHVSFKGLTTIFAHLIIHFFREHHKSVWLSPFLPSPQSASFIVQSRNNFLGRQPRTCEVRFWSTSLALYILHYRFPKWQTT